MILRRHVALSAGLSLLLLAAGPKPPPRAPAPARAPQSPSAQIRYQGPTSFVMGDQAVEVHDGPRPKGAPANETFEDVLAVVGSRDVRCTAVLVGPRHALTAKHCLPATRVLAGSDVTRPRASRAVVQTILADDKAPWATSDVAILALDAPLPGARARRGERDSMPPSGALSLVGFGTNEASGTRGAGKKRVTEVMAHGFGCDGRRPVTLGCDPAREMVIPRRRDNDTCAGDSGGPVFERFEGGLRLVAITSRAIPSARSRCGQGGIYTRVDRIAPWIFSVTKGPRS